MPRTFESTHDWIRFQLDLTRAPVALWMLLGEARSKCEHMSQVPLLPAVAERMHRLALVRGVAATTAIEGNTLTEEEVERHFDGLLQLPPSRQYLATEVDNVLGAINETARVLAIARPAAVRPEEILALNRRLLDGLPRESDVVPGAIRSHSVTVGRYRGAPPEDCAYLLDRLCEWLGETWIVNEQGVDWNVPQALLKAILAHLYIAWIHPFGDGNGRTARLLEFRLLASAGVPTAASHLLSNHYNKTRSRYYQELDAASRSGGNVIPFLLYALNGFVDEMKLQLAEMHDQHRQLLWKHHVTVTLGTSTSAAKRRQAELAVRLGELGSVFQASALAHLSAPLAAAYARRHGRTLARDLAELQALDLLVNEDGGWRAKTEVLAAMLPILPPGAARSTSVDFDGHQPSR